MTAAMPDLPELQTANHALGDPAALDRLFEEQGYLFFCNVLDSEAVARARGRVLAILADLGVVDRDAAEAVWNGADLTGFPDKVEALYRAGIWQELVADPAISGLVRQVMGGPISWVPLNGYRTTAPGAGDLASPFAQRHQDGFMNGDIPFRICWIPLDRIDRETGGLVLAEGQHRRGYLHDSACPPRHPIPADAIPAGAWRSAAFAPGDMVMFHYRIPHAGLPNRSPRFRLSLDVRVMPEGHPDFPLVGRIASIGPDRAEIDCDGEVRAVRFDEETYFRANSGARLSFDDVLPFLAPGTEVMVGRRDGVTTLMKPIQ